MSLKKGQNTKKEEPSDRMEDPGGMEDVQQPEASKYTSDVWCIDW